MTCTAQASLLTGKPPEGHGVVGNGWLFRETGEVRFWQQSNALIQAEPLYVTARRLAAERGRTFRAAKLFWWFNQGAAVDFSVTPKPYYGADGNKAFGIAGTPDGLTDRLEKSLGPFPFRTFWGPGAGLPCTDWIARCAADLLATERPDLTLVYLPHLDYDPQRFGPSGSRHAPARRRARRRVRPAARRRREGRRAGLGRQRVRPLRRLAAPVLLNRVLRRAGLLHVRPGPFGEVFDPFTSRAFAVCDHQLAHVYVADLARPPAGPRTARGRARRRAGLSKASSAARSASTTRGRASSSPWPSPTPGSPTRSGSTTATPPITPGRSTSTASRATTRASSSSTRSSPGPKGRAMFRLLQKKLGFRTLFDVIPLDPSLVRGSHGLPAARPAGPPPPHRRRAPAR